MFNFNKIFTPKKFILAIANVTSNGIELSASMVSSSGEVIIEAVDFESLEKVVDKFGKYVSYWLHIDGVGVLTRIVDTQSDYQRDLIINGNPEDFYFTSVSERHTRLVSFVRKSVAESLVHYFIENKLFLHGISCGFAPIGMLVEDGKSLKLEYSVDRKNGEFSELIRNENYQRRAEINGQFLSKAGVIGQALWSNNSMQELRLEHESFTKIQNEAIEYSKFKNLGIISVGGILLVLLVNYFYLNHLNQDIVDKEELLSLNNSNLTILDNLEQEEMRKQQLVLNSGVATNNFLSFYLEEIGKSVPKEIILSEMYVFPLVEKLKEKRKVEIDKTKIEVSGWTNSNVVLDDWIELLDRKEWIKSVELMNYQKSATIDAEFRCIIILGQ